MENVTFRGQKKRSKGPVAYESHTNTPTDIDSEPEETPERMQRGMKAHGHDIKKQTVEQGAWGHRGHKSLFGGTPSTPGSQRDGSSASIPPMNGSRGALEFLDRVPYPLIIHSWTLYNRHALILLINQILIDPENSQNNMR